jgi:hypothetical protein
MIYETENFDAKDFILQINIKLQGIEVKGDSVGNLFTAEVMLKQLFDNLKEKIEKEVT